MSSSRRLILHWFRRDLRLRDNIALHQAREDGGSVLPLYIASDWSGRHSWTGPKRQAFLCGCLSHLAASIEKRGGSLIFRSGDAVEELEMVLKQSKAEALYFNRDPDPFGKNVEKRVEALCKRLGVECKSFHDVTLHAPDEVATKTGNPYKVFTPYSRNWESLQKPTPVPDVRSFGNPPELKSECPPTLAHWKLKAEETGEILAAGEEEARKRLRHFLAETAGSYAEDRDFPALHGGSRLSQDLRFGLLSPRTIYAEVQEAMRKTTSSKMRESLEVFIRELAWREFYMAVLHYFPEVLEKEFNPAWHGLPWNEPDEKFEAWKQGRTGFPIVDAGMRQLVQTGFMHNRVRMITAMFLTKDLHLDWRLGEQFFMQHLVDGEIANNNGGWQWSAGVGADAAPYFRIQNPWSQAKRYDPQAKYIKRWLPELRDVPVKRLMEPPANGKGLVESYSPPCVEHGKEREKTLTIFKKHRAKSR